MLAQIDLVSLAAVAHGRFDVYLIYLGGHVQFDQWPPKNIAAMNEMPYARIQININLI